MSQFVDSIRAVKKNYAKYDEWEQSQADERAKKEYLAKNLDIPQDKLELTKEKAKAVVRATEIMDKRSEDNCEDTEQVIGMMQLPPLLIATLGIPQLFNLYANKVDKKFTDKIAKLEQKAIEMAQHPNKLKLIKEEIEAIKKSQSSFAMKAPSYGQLLALPAIFLMSAFFIMWGTKKQKEASRIGRYQAKQNELKNIKNFVIYTPEQQKQAEEIAKKIPDVKEDKNNMTRVFKNYSQIKKDREEFRNWNRKRNPHEIEDLKSKSYTPEQLQLGKEDKELIVDTVKEINMKAEEYSENVENTFDTLGMLSWLADIPLIYGLGKILKPFKFKQAWLKPVIQYGVPIVSSLTISLMGTFEQKKGAQVGRYMARKDLLSNPARLVAFSDEDMKKADNIKAPEVKKSFGQKLKQSFTFLSTYIKDKNEFKKYQKTERSKAEKLQKAYEKIEISESQKKEAEILKKNVYTAFDEVDEMSQRYSEDVEAGCDIAKTSFSQIWSLGYLGAILWGTVAFAKGKFPISKIVNTITNMSFKKDSALRKGINEIYKELKKDKKVMHEFQRAIFSSSRLKVFLAKPEHKNITSKLAPLLAEFSLYGLKAKTTKDPNVIAQAIKGQMKDGAVAKWARNIITQGSALFMKFKFDVDPFAGQSTWKSYKTLIGTGSVLGLPILGTLFALPYAFNAWLTNIQKKAGKIGIMKAMEKIDDDRVFAHDSISNNSKSETKASEKSSNLLEQYKLQ